MLRRKDNPCIPIEILGDNVDILITPANMTSDRQRKSWHWFLLLATQKRIIDQELPTNKPVADIETISSCVFFHLKWKFLIFKEIFNFMLPESCQILLENSNHSKNFFQTIYYTHKLKKRPRNLCL